MISNDLFQFSHHLPNLYYSQYSAAVIFPKPQGALKSTTHPRASALVIFCFNARGTITVCSMRCTPFLCIGFYYILPLVSISCKSPERMIQVVQRSSFQPPKGPGRMQRIHQALFFCCAVYCLLQAVLIGLDHLLERVTRTTSQALQVFVRHLTCEDLDL